MIWLHIQPPHDYAGAEIAIACFTGTRIEFDLLLDIVVNRNAFNGSLYRIDEPEIHLNTKVQRTLLRELFRLIPENSQLWLATHSIGMVRAAQEILTEPPGVSGIRKSRNMVECSWFCQAIRDRFGVEPAAGGGRSGGTSRLHPPGFIRSRARRHLAGAPGRSPAGDEVAGAVVDQRGGSSGWRMASPAAWGSRA